MNFDFIHLLAITGGMLAIWSGYGWRRANKGWSRSNDQWEQAIAQWKAANKRADECLALLDERDELIKLQKQLIEELKAGR